MAIKKLIEVALPLEAINTASIKEKSIRRGHPSTLHLWWARRPLATARAVIWASLVDDPSSHPELFPTETEQQRERQRLFLILEELVKWENTGNEDVLSIAKQEIMKYTNNCPPDFLDPFAGGGAIPFEAHRLGLSSNAHDLNPVAVMINKAMIEIPASVYNRPSISGYNSKFINETRMEGICEDIKFYCKWIYSELKERVGNLYFYNDKTPVAWIWTRTVKCPNPTCRCEMPLTSSFILSKKKGNEFSIKPVIEGKKIRFEVVGGKPVVDPPKLGRGAKFQCLICGQVTPNDYVKNESQISGMNNKLMAVVYETSSGKKYCSPSEIDEQVFNSIKDIDVEMGEISTNPRWFSPPIYGIKDFAQMFSKRQMHTLMEFQKLLDEMQKKPEIVKSGEDYSNALRVYISFVFDKIVAYSTCFGVWRSDHETFERIYGRQAMAMVWDYPEINILREDFWDNQVQSVCDCIVNFHGRKGSVLQKPAQVDTGMRNIMISTDPPYYDNIGYADLSDFFYVWMRKSLNKIYPELFSTMLVPKAEELIATPHRFNGSMPNAKNFFESEMLIACKQIYKYATDDIPVTIYYAYKQSDSDDKDGKMVSSGWETMLSSIVNAGFSITGTWPMRTEQTSALKSNVNALASSIVLVCRKRELDSPKITRRNLISLLRKELRPALKNLQDSNIAPVDLAQSAIGPGMGIFSRYSKVIEADGSEMSVRSALKIINEEIDMYFNEQVGELDSASRFCIELYMQNAFNEIRYGEAEVLANAKGASIPSMSSLGFLYAKAGKVHLIERELLPDNVRIDESNIWLLTQQLTRTMSVGGIDACAKAIVSMLGSNVEKAKDLAYRLYTIADQKKWAEEAYAYNSLVVAWPDIQSRASELKAIEPKQLSLF